MTLLLTESDADRFARSWLTSWNAHDIDAITSHYHEDVEYSSPFVAAPHGRGGRMSGRHALRDYVAAALERYPDLYLGPAVTVAAGAGSVAIVYRSIDDLLAVETFLLDDSGLITAVHCHYRSDPRSYP